MTIIYSICPTVEIFRELAAIKPYFRSILLHIWGVFQVPWHLTGFAVSQYLRYDSFVA